MALSAPWSIAATQTSIVLSAVVLVAMILARRWTYPRLPRTLVAVLVFLAIQALSIPFGIHPGRSARFLPHYSWVLLFPFVFWGFFRDRTARTRAATILVWSGAVAGYYGALQHLTTAVWFRKTPEALPGGGYVAVGMFGHHLTYAGVLLPIFFLSLGLLADAPRKRAWAITTLGLTLGLVASVARSAWIGWFAGILLFGFLLGRRWFLGIAAAGTATAALVLAIAPAVRERAATLFAMGDDPRLRLWETALRIGADYPILGAGVGSFGSLFPTYRVPGWYMATGHPHSDPLNILVETGWVGVLAWFAIWVAFFFDTSRRAPASPGKPPGAGLRAAVRAGMFAMVIAGFGQCYSTDEEVAEVWWLVAATGLAFAAYAPAPSAPRTEPVAATASRATP